MDTMERVETVKPPRQKRNGPLVAAAAFALVIIIGLVGAMLASTDEGTEPANPTTTTAPTTTAAPTTTLAPAPIDVEAAEPIQVQNDQASRATIEFAGNAESVVDGAYAVEIEMYIEANTLGPGVTVTLSSIEGELTSTGLTDEGVEFAPTWAWTPDGDKVIATMVGRGVTIPDTRPAVVVTVQETASSDPVEFVLTAEAGSGRPG